jgi:hypothetical protein
MKDQHSHTKTQAILNIIKMEDLHDTHDCKAKLNYSDTNPKPKGKVGIQFNGCMQECELEGESI